MSLIKLFCLKGKSFLYDAKTNRFIRLYEEKGLNHDIEKMATERLSNLLEREYSHTEEFTLCPPLDYQSLQYLIGHNCSQLVLSLTEQCNMRCEYCGYHDRYDDGNLCEEMSLGTAKKAIKLYLEHAVAVSEVVISFYGGEPLLKLEFIKECVQYAQSMSLGQHIKFHITTNGVLLNRDVVDYLKDHDFVVSVSIDGPRTLHDRYRKSIDKKGTYDTVINNLKNIYFNDPEYFCNNFIFMPVYAPPKNDLLLYDFFEKAPVNYMLGNLYVTPYFEEVIEKMDLSSEIILTGEEKCQYSKFKQISIDSLYKYKALFESTNSTIDKTFPAGNCIPVCKKIYSNARGNLFLCEKVSETVDNCIGNVNDGIDTSKVYMQYNRMMEVYKKLGCQSCWAIHFCSVCFRDYDSVSRKRCDGIRQRVEKEMIASIKEWGE